MDSALWQWMTTPDTQDGQALWDCGSLYIITRTNFLSWSYSASCHPYTLDALSCLRMSERSLILFFISYLAEGTSLNSFGHILVAFLGYSSWDKLRTSRGRRCHGRAEVHWSPDYQVWEDFPVVSCRGTSLFPGWLSLTSTLWVNFLSPVIVY